MKYVCLFDIDGTLLNSGGAGQLAMERALEREFGVAGPYHDIPAAGRTDRAITTDLFAFHKMQTNVEEWDRFIRSYFELLPAALAELDGRVLPGIVSLLSALSERDDVSLGLLTGNFREGAILKLRHYAIDSHFAYGGFGDHYFDRDDVARDALQQAREYLSREIVPSQVLVIGDTPSDVRCARAINAQAVAVGTGIFTCEELSATSPDHLFQDFSDFEKFLSLLA